MPITAVLNEHVCEFRTVKMQMHQSPPANHGQMSFMVTLPLIFTFRWVIVVSHHEPTCLRIMTRLTYSRFFGWKALQTGWICAAGVQDVQISWQKLAFAASTDVNGVLFEWARCNQMCVCDKEMSRERERERGRQLVNQAVTVVQHLPTPTIKDLFVSLSGPHRHTQTLGHFKWLHYITALKRTEFE